MWTHAESIETSATPARIWAIWKDVPGWKTWNDGIEAIELDGPFDLGTTFSMKTPGEAPFISTLLEVHENKSFTDETVIDGTRVVVRHTIEVLPSGRSRVTYRTEITGPAANEFGPMVTGDFPDVLQGLKRLAERDRGDTLGHELYGLGPQRVLILNDWLCDTSTWDETHKYLDGERFTFVFIDLRGYGRSRGRTGRFTVDEAADDVLALADAHGWQQFCVVGHSMSSLVALHLAQHHAGRVLRAVVLTPPPPAGFGADDAMLAAAQSLAMADDATRLAAFAQRFGDRLTPAWTEYKTARWRASADPAAAAAYVAMFARDGLPDPTARIAIPVLAVTGEQDVPPLRREAVLRTLGPLCDQLVVESLADAGHYPMQEMPPLTAALVERFLATAPPIPSNPARDA